MNFWKKAGFVAGILFLVLSAGAWAQDNRLTEEEKKAGWRLLFDGRTTKGWKGAFMDSFPGKGWKIENGVLAIEASGGHESTNAGDIVTIEEYADFELSVDFKLTEGANSGIKYFVDARQATPSSPRSAFGLEYQLLDDLRHPDAKMGKDGNRTLGSLYDLIPAIDNKPSRPIGQWNTARIVSKGNLVQHWLNGIKVVEYQRGSEAFKQLVAGSKYKDIPGFGLIPKGRILLQDHGDQAFFKNIKIKAIPAGDAGEGRLFSGATNDRLGVVSYTFRNSFQKDAAATLDTIRSLGFTNIEFSNLFGRTAAELKKLLDERGMKCTSFGVSYEDVTSRTGQVAQNAKTLGASYVRVAWIPHDNAVPFSVQTAQQAADDFNKAGKILKEQYGLTFCYHNHGYEFVPYQKGTLYDYLVAHTSPDYVSFELDILWAAFPGMDPAILLEKYGQRYRLMHVKDLRKGVAGDFSGHTAVGNDVAVGSGQIDIPAVIRASKNSAIQYYYIEDESDNINQQVPESLRFLKNL